MKNGRALVRTMFLGGPAALALAVVAAPGWAQGVPAPVPPPVAQPAVAPAEAAAAVVPPPSTNAMVNLIRALVAQGALKPELAQPLLQQAENEAEAAAQAARIAAAPSGTLRVPYVPESVRQQIRDELRADVLQAARQEGWAQPGQVAEWTRGLILSGDFRLRNTQSLFEAGNADNIIDFAAVNAQGPLDINPVTRPGNPPFLNTRKDRNRFALRARLALDANITPTVAVGLRIATGDNDSPVSTNQVLGGGFGKKDIWLDRAFVRFAPAPWVSLTAGRMANPFYSAPILWDEDVNFDGAALSLDSAGALGRALRLGATIGAFPLEYSGFGAPQNDSTKQGDQNKWLFAGQVTAHYQATSRVAIKAGAAYYSFDGVQGEVSEPCFLFDGASVDCSTDDRRPAFLQKGNTLFGLRNIVGPIGQPLFEQRQFAGLTFDYDILNLNADVTVKLGGRYQLMIGGDYIKNLGLDAADLCKSYAGVTGRIAPRVLPGFNNVAGTRCVAAADGAANVSYTGGDTAWMVRAYIGDPAPAAFGEWRVGAEYRYIESDAVLDQFVDNDFYLGGTNAEGYVLQGVFGLGRNIYSRARWFSGNEITGFDTDTLTGAPLSIDVLQVDLVVGF